MPLNKSASSLMLLLILGSSALSGCNAPEKSVPSEKMLIDLFEGYSNKHGGVYKFYNIKKLDGQLQPDGLHYLMEYQATLKTSSCFSLPLHNSLEFTKSIDFSKSINKNPAAHHCTEGKVLAYRNSGAHLINGLQSSFQTKAIFTKKESGWQMIDSGVYWDSLNSR